MSAADIDAILARFPAPVALYPSRRKWWLTFALCLAFTVGGILMIRDGQGSGWFVLIVFGLFSLVAAVMFLPGAGSLKLDAGGFEVTSLFRRNRIHWRDTSDFDTARVPPSMINLVVYDDAALAQKAMAGVNTAITGRNAGLPDTYGLSAENLAALMNLWRERSTAR